MSAGSAPGRRVDEVRAALMLLTWLPVGRFDGPPPDIAAAAWAWPVAGAAVGFCMAVVLAAGMWLGLPPLPAAVLAVGAGTLASGAMHEDGLADLADGFGGGATAERKLEIMRDSRIGSYGVVALVLSLGFRIAAIAALANAAGADWALIAIAAARRAPLAAALSLLPPARADGLGRMAAAGPVMPLPSILVGLLFLVPLGVGAAAATGLAVGAAALAVGLLARRQIVGQTGDVLGAMQQAGEIGGWAALLALAG